MTVPLADQIAAVRSRLQYLEVGDEDVYAAVAREWLPRFVEIKPCVFRTHRLEPPVEILRGFDEFGSSSAPLLQKLCVGQFCRAGRIKCLHAVHQPLRIASAVRRWVSVTRRGNASKR